MGTTKAPRAVGRKYPSADRHKAILRALCAHPAGMTVKEVHQLLVDQGMPERSERTVQADLRHLSEQTQNIEVERVGKADLYRWIAKRPAWDVEIDDRERVLLMLAQKHLEDLLPKEVRDLLSSKLEAPSTGQRSGELSKRLLDWPDKVAVVPLLPQLVSPTVSPDVLSGISTALISNQKLIISYRNASGRLLSSKTVLPLALVQQAERLYLVCRFEGRDDTRHLALHRIKSAEVTPHGFERPAFSLQDYIAQGHFGFGNGERINLKIAVQPHLAELLSETPLSKDQVMTSLKDGTSLVSSPVIRGEQIRWWLRMHGSAVRLIEPAGLLDEVDSAQPARTPV